MISKNAIYKRRFIDGRLNRFFFSCFPLYLNCMTIVSQTIFKRLNSQWMYLGFCWPCIEPDVHNLSVRHWVIGFSIVNSSCAQIVCKDFESWAADVWSLRCYSQRLFELHLCIGSCGHEAEWLWYLTGLSTCM